MISRIAIFIFLIILLPEAYIYKVHLRRRGPMQRWKRVMWWLPTAVLSVYTVALCCIPDFAPSDQLWLNLYLLLFGLFAAPKFLFMLSSLIGLGVKRGFGLHRNYGTLMGLSLSVVVVAAVLYGSFVGVQRLTVRHVEIEFSDLPKSFDGYRIVHISDLHVGSIPHGLLSRAVDSINAAHADAVMMTGDLQNMQPGELPPVAPLLSRLKARDGVFAVLGNHDYGMYVAGPDSLKAANEARLVRLERGFGWQLLLNENRVVRRGNDSIVVAGEQNVGRPPFPMKGDLRRTLRGVGQGAFVVLMQHDPWAWEQTILPQSRVQLTLSGHTHGGQISVLGLRPTQFNNNEDCGLYFRNRRALYVSSGLGGFVPFRLGVYPEIVVITLKVKNKVH